MQNSIKFKRLRTYVIAININNIWLIALVLLGLSGCGGSSNTASPVNDNPPATIGPVPTPPIDNESPSYLPESSQFVIGQAADFGFNPDLLQSAFDMAGSNPNVSSLLVVKENHLIAEQYFNGADPQQLRHWRSVTKTVTAMIVGLALEQGIIANLDITLGDVLSQQYPQLTAAQSEISLKHLLTMSSGFSWNETSDSDFIDWVDSDDPVGFLLSRPLINEPGTVFNYNSAGVHLISVMLDILTNGNIEELVITGFFEPLGIDNFQWERLSDGRINGSAGLQLSSEDALKIGLLMINQGQYLNEELKVENGTGNSLKTQQIIPELWMTEMLIPRVSFELSQGNADLNGYGFLTWLGFYQGDGVHQGQPFYQASGYGGQLIVGFPDLSLAMVGSNPFRVDFEQSLQQTSATMNLMVDGILASLQ